jgi:hypothetical protein
MNGFRPFLYLSNHTVCPQNTVRTFCGYIISAKSHREITGKVKLSTSEAWEELNTGISCFRIKGAAMYWLK